VASVIVTPTAQRDLEELIRTQTLPASTRERLRRSLEPLRVFPLLGAPLHGRWSRFRFVLGPWRWMIVVYDCDHEADRVAIITIQDARSARSPATS
jgi:plasmid stabilization system protein ParE